MYFDKMLNLVYSHLSDYVIHVFSEIAHSQKILFFLESLAHNSEVSEHVRRRKIIIFELQAGIEVFYRLKERSSHQFSISILRIFSFLRHSNGGFSTP